MRLVVILFCAALAGCSGIARPPVARCPIPGETPYTLVQLFFGLDVPGRGPVSDTEWADFAARAITEQFPDGFTVVNGAGQWYDQRSGNLVREPSKVLIVAADPESDLRTRIGSVVDAYKRQFHQQSVGVVTSEACGVF